MRGANGLPFLILSLLASVAIAGVGCKRVQQDAVTNVFTMNALLSLLF